MGSTNYIWIPIHKHGGGVFRRGRRVSGWTQGGAGVRVVSLFRGTGDSLYFQHEAPTAFFTPMLTPKTWVPPPTPSHRGGRPPPGLKTIPVRGFRLGPRPNCQNTLGNAFRRPVVFSGAISPWAGKGPPSPFPGATNKTEACRRQPLAVGGRRAGIAPAGCPCSHVCEQVAAWSCDVGTACRPPRCGRGCVR